MKINKFIVSTKGAKCLNNDSAIKFCMVVLMFAVIVSGLLFIISFAKNEVEK